MLTGSVEVRVLLEALFFISISLMTALTLWELLRWFSGSLEAYYNWD